MRIIVDTEKEELLELSEYLHDFLVYRGKKKTLVLKKGADKRIKLKKGQMVCLEMDDGISSCLRHLYQSPELIEVE